jgi:hypothetical protein
LDPVIVSGAASSARAVASTANYIHSKSHDKQAIHALITTQNFVCSMQASLANFHAGVAAKHTALRNANENVLSQHTQTTQNRRAAQQKAASEKEALRLSVEALDSYLDEKLKSVCENVFIGMANYFSPRSKARKLHNPRMCVKLRDGQEIYSFHRSSPNQTSIRVNIEELKKLDKGFRLTCDSGEAYCQNRLHDEFLAHRYENPRLRASAAGVYSNSFYWHANRLFSRKIRKRQVVDEKWANCWTPLPGKTDVSAEDAYKSTLIVPMSLRTVNIERDLKDWLFGNNSQPGGNILNIGMLCIDCHDEDFFFEGLDKGVVTVFADLLSLFFIYARLHTENSEVYKDAKKISINL